MLDIPTACRVATPVFASSNVEDVFLLAACFAAPRLRARSIALTSSWASRALVAITAARYTAVMTPDEARQLLDYHVWARERALAAVAALAPDQFLRDLGNSFGSVRDTLAHLYGADEVWLSRWRGGTPRGLPPASQFPDLASLRAAWAKLDPDMRAFVHSLDAAGLARPLTYPAFNGQMATLTYEQMLQHVVNHGSYHRGQVTTLVRQLGASAPKGMDFVAFLRERAG